MSARLCIRALQAAGMDVRGIDLSDRFLQDNQHIAFDLPDANGHEGPGTLLLLINAPVVPLALMQLGKKVIADKRIVGYFAWELPLISADWTPGLKFVHDIIAPSRFTADAIQPFVPDEVKVLAYPVHATAKLRVTNFRPPRCKLLVLVMFNFGSGFVRKNPMASIEAFKRAYGGNGEAHLIVKMQNGASFPLERRQLLKEASTLSNIHFIEKEMDDAELAGLIEESDVLLSLHRSEGFGLTLAEAMLKGKCVVATDWSGNHDYLSDATGFPVPYRLVPAIDFSGNYHFPDQLWAEPDVEAAAGILKSLMDPELREKIGGQARQYAGVSFTPDRYAEDFCRILRFQSVGGTSLPLASHSVKTG
ncbi:MAG: glycosyltransferase family 4 protein [Parvibaculaceae bacterium]|nr:glycosyltransferase family 4 protein [Parvibaculaceae bacterium]